MRLWHCLNCLNRIFSDYFRDPLFAGTDHLGLAFARVVWFGWFVSLCLYTLHARCYSEPLSDLVFAQAVGIVSASAILLTLPPCRKSRQLHCVMLLFSCVVYVSLQRPMAFTPHGTFLRTFARIQSGMTTEQVRAILFSYQASDDHYKRQRAFVNSEAARQWWFNGKYSGRLHLSHADPDSINGVYDIYFQNGKVIAAYCQNN